MKKIILLSIFVFSSILLSAQNVNYDFGNGSGISFPITFSPNNDGNNDFFLPQYSGINNYKLTVYNRWGSVLFTTEAIQKPWDGTFEGKECPQGTYYWVSEFSSYVNGNLVEETLKETVTLIRD